MAINKILGDMLAANLERSEDLAIETDLIYVDVANNRVGVKTNSPVTDFSIDGNASVSSLTPGRVVYTGADNILFDDGSFTFDGTTLTVPELSAAIMGLGNLAVNNNTISATNTNGDIILSPDGSGDVILNSLTYPAADGTSGQFLTTDGSGNLSFATVTQTFSIAGDTGSDTVTTGETLTFAGGEGIDTAVTDNAITFNISNPFIGIGSDTVNLGSTITDINGLTSIDIDNITINGNIISSTNTDGKIVISPNGVGVVEIDTRTGIVIPIGTTEDRSALPVPGEMRYNTEIGLVEYYNGAQWTSLTPPYSDFDTQVIVGDGTTVTFDLDKLDVNNSSAVFVVIGGTVQTPESAYTISNGQITFAEAPLNSDEIQVRYITETSDLGSVVTVLDLDNFVITNNDNAAFIFNSTEILKVNANGITVDGEIIIGNLIIRDNGDGTLGVYYGDGSTEASLNITSENAQKWTTARSITLDGAVTGSVSVDGSSDVTLTTTLNLTGTPTAPTAAAGTNTTQIATTEFVTTAVGTAVTNLLDDAPGVLDTLNELAAAIGDDANFITTINDSIDTKLSLSGGTMTGSIDMASNILTGLLAPTSATDAVNKTYVDSVVSSAITSGEIVLGEGTSGNFVSQITAGEGIDVSGTSGVSAEVVISAEDASATNKGIASFDAEDFVVNSGAVTLSEERIQDIVGAMVTNNATEGVITTYDDLNQKINLSVTDFNIILTGDVTGTALVTTFGNDITINTTTESILGITVQDDFVDVGNSGTVDTLSFNGSNIELTRTGNTIAVSVADGISESDVRDTIGTTVKGTIRDPDTETETESGITVNYDSENNTVELGVREFDITLVGDITGSGTVSRLQDVTITTTADFIAGITVQDDSVDLGSAGTVDTLSFDGSNIVTTRNGNTVNISIPTGLTAEDVRDEIGSTLRGTIRDGSTELTTESGITVNYDSENDIVELGVREFDINLTGAVTGSATVEKLQDVTIFTESSAIDGLTITKNSTAVGSPEQIKTLNFTGSNLEVGINNLDSTVLDITVSGVVDEASVVDIMKPKLTGSHDGLTVSYDNFDRTFDLAIDPITINLSGAVTGSGTVTFDGSGTDSAVNINTSLGGGTAEIQVSDEYETQGTVSSINFVGGGITTAVSLDGTTATVYVPNSPANETFLTVEAGSENIPNARRLVAGTGISITDGGASKTLTISAASDAILAKSQIALDDTLVGQQIELNFKGSRFIQPIIEDDNGNDRINITIYDIKEYWFRSNFDCGNITDDEGPILNMGDNLKKGIFETKPDLGSIA